MDGINNGMYREYYSPTSKTRTDGAGNQFDAVFTDEKEKSVAVQDFLNLMVAQLKNQDFMNPVDDTQYVTQLAQFATMQQMQELASYSKQNYVLSLIGKEVTAAKFTLSGDLDKVTGPVEKISLVNNEYKIIVGGKQFSLEQIMEINGTGGPKDESQVDASKYTIEAKNITSDSVEFSWPKPQSKDGLKYTAYYSTNSEMDTVDDVIKNGIQIGQADREDLTAESLKGLEPNTTYFVNVVVTDKNGNQSIYKKAVFKTLETDQEA